MFVDHWMHVAGWTAKLTEYSALLILMVVLISCLARELRVPRLRFPGKTLLRSYVANVETFIFNDTLLSLLSLPSLFYIAQNFSHYGLLSRLPEGLWKWLLSFVLLDLTMYAWHVANHRWDSLWRFHKVHHSDITLNATTGLRFHAGELVLTVLVKCVFIVLAGVGAELVIANELLLTAFVVFHHMNSSPPLEKILGRLFVMPRLHRLHHSVRRDQHDHNYGGALVLWDRLFGTFREGEPEAIGLRNVSQQSFWEMIRFGLSANSAPAAGKSLPIPVERTDRQG